MSHTQTASPRLRDDSEFITFGVVTTFASSFGQTYFIGVFQDPITQEFGLSASQFGGMYFLLTVISAVALGLVGHIIDKAPLARYMMWVVGGLTLSCGLMALSSSIWIVFAGLLLARFTGQGLMTHAAMTSISRYFDRRRGRAVAVVGMGFPIGQAILPPLAVWLIAGNGLFDLGWRVAWLASAVFGLVIILPSIQFLLKTHKARHAAFEERLKAGAVAAEGANVASLTRKDMLRDPKFYSMLPAVISGPFWITAIFFFAADLADKSGLSLQAFTGLYWIYSIAAILVPVPTGWLVDRIGGRRLMMVPQPVLALGVAGTLLFDGVLGVGITMAALGLVLGLLVPINNSVWAELYGPKHLGAVKSLASSIGVLSTALSPFLIGAMIDSGIEMDTILIGGVIHCLLTIPFLIPVVLSAKRAAIP